jgi:hypothetical protein
MNQNQKDKFKHSNNRRSTISRKRKNFLNFGFLISLLLALILGTSVSYVLVKNDMSIKGFVINDLQKKVNHLNKERNLLELNLTFIESYSNLAYRVEELGMVKVEKIDYINMSDDCVAMR